jgi:hypothetical protein
MRCAAGDPEGGRQSFSISRRACSRWPVTFSIALGCGLFPSMRSSKDDYEAAYAVFDDKELVDLTLAVGLMNTYDRLAISFRASPRAAANA